MEKKNNNIHPAVIAGIGVGAAAVGAAGTAAAQSVIGSVSDAALPDDAEDAVVVAEDAAPEAPAPEAPAVHHHTGTVHHQSEDEQHVEALEDELVAVEAVDANDAVAEDAIEYGEVGVIVAEDGEEHHYAVVEVANQQVTMVDIDDDNVFDVAQDDQGIVYDINNPNTEVMMVSDAEVQLQEQQNEYEYLAQTELDNNTDTSLTGDHYYDDVVEV